jgi:hypothetical protein
VSATVIGLPDGRVVERSVRLSNLIVKRSPFALLRAEIAKLDENDEDSIRSIPRELDVLSACDLVDAAASFALEPLLDRFSALRELALPKRVRAIVILVLTRLWAPAR